MPWPRWTEGTQFMRRTTSSVWLKGSRRTGRQSGTRPWPHAGRWNGRRLDTLGRWAGRHVGQVVDLHLSEYHGYLYENPCLVRRINMVVAGG